MGGFGLNDQRLPGSRHEVVDAAVQLPLDDLIRALAVVN